jgi:hypothetical protein
MTDPEKQNELTAVLRSIKEQLERIAGSLETLVEVVENDRKEKPTPFPTSHMREPS